MKKYYRYVRVCCSDVYGNFTMNFRRVCDGTRGLVYDRRRGIVFNVEFIDTPDEVEASVKGVRL